MKIRGLIDEDFVNYKKPSMFIAFSTCTWKCEKECGIRGICQNSELAKTPEIEIDNNELIDRYLKNKITCAIVLAGLEPIDSFSELVKFIHDFREKSFDDIVIYTGYYKEEIQEKLSVLKEFNHIIIKFGRFIPNQPPHKDPILGVDLASDNQYAEQIS